VFNFADKFILDLMSTEYTYLLPCTSIIFNLSRLVTYIEVARGSSMDLRPSPYCPVLLPAIKHFVHTNVGTNNPMIRFASDNLFGLIYAGQRGPERNLTVVYAKSMLLLSVAS